MQTSYISTSALRNAPRTEIIRMEAELTDRAKEVATGRRADVGLWLGSGTSRDVATRNDLTMVEALRISNGSATARLSQTQAALSDLEEIASEVLASLTALPTGNTGALNINIQARGSLDRMVDRLNGSDGGSYLFGGQNSTVVPAKRFADGPEAAIAAAFQGKFGFPPNDPLAASILGSDMEDFLASEMEALFQLPAWTTDWSSASSENMVSQISPAERLETSTNANQQSIRTLAKGLSMVAGLGLEGLSQEARNAVVAKARLELGKSITEVVALKGGLGFAQNAIERADDRMLLARDLLVTKITSAEGADPAEAKTRIDLLTTQIQMSYALTAQLSKLSILNYA